MQVKWWLSGRQTALDFGSTQLVTSSEVFPVEAFLEKLLGFSVVNIGLAHVVTFIGVSTPLGVGALQLQPLHDVVDSALHHRALISGDLA
jgi:hypothetical protein